MQCRRRSGPPRAARRAPWATTGSRRFSDPQLDELVAEALAYNPDLRVAAARVEQAAAYAGRRRDVLYSAGEPARARRRQDERRLERAARASALFAIWELDLWGRVRSGAAAAESQYVSAAARLPTTRRQSIAALVAKGWFLATEARMQKALADDTVRASRAPRRPRAGSRCASASATSTTSRLAQANLQAFRDAAQQPRPRLPAGAARARDARRDAIPRRWSRCGASSPPAPAPVPVGLPSELLERRPDVVAAERRVAAAFYRTEEAKAARLPRISLTASGVEHLERALRAQGAATTRSGASAPASSRRCSSAASSRRQVEIRTAEQKQAVAEYGTDRRARLRRGRERAVDRLRARRARGDPQAGRRGKRAGARAREHPLPRRLGRPARRAAAELALYAAQVSLIRVRSERLVQRVNLHLALGGSFGERPAELQPGEPKPAAESESPQ